MSACSDIRTALDALLDGELDLAGEEAVRVHLGLCPACARDLEERRAWNDTLARSFQYGLEGVESIPADRARVAEALASASRRRSLGPAKLAAAVVIVLSVGLVAAALSFSKPSEEQVARVVDRLKEREEKDAQLRTLQGQIARELEGARQAVQSRRKDDSASSAVTLGVWNLEERLAPEAPKEATLAQLVARTGSPDLDLRSAARAALRRVGPTQLVELRAAEGGDREFVRHVVADLERRARPEDQVAVTQEVDGVVVAVTQLSDGRVRVTAPGVRIEAPNMGELLRSHAELCRQYAISGREGFLRVGKNAAGVDWRGQLDLLFRTGGWDEQVQRDAYRFWAAGRSPDPREVERRVTEYQERCRLAGEPAPPPARVDVASILRDVKALTRKELERTQDQVEAETKKLAQRLQELQEVRARARGLRVFAEDLKTDR